MPNVKVVDMKGNEVGTMELDESVFGAEINTATLHAVVKAYLANQRQGTQSTLTRSEVSGGGKKPWRQKGTGRARQGSTRSPQWTHGGIALGPKPRSYRMSVNKKVKTSAMLSALSAKVASNELIVVDTIALENYSTKTIAEMLKAFGVTKTLTKKYWPAPNAEEKVSHEVTVPDTALIVLDNTDEKVIGSCANIETVSTAFCGNVNVYEILANSKLVMTKAAVEALTERLKEVNA